MLSRYRSTAIIYSIVDGIEKKLNNHSKLKTRYLKDFDSLLSPLVAAPDDVRPARVTFSNDAILDDNSLCLW